jgi:uncharacterized Tic20 family protein
MNVADELHKLDQLHQAGALSDEEFARAKDAVLNPPSALGVAATDGLTDPAVSQQQTRQWAMFVHLSQLANFVVPFSGFVVPIVLWQVKKAELPGIDVHGKIVVNWILSAIIYGFACIPLLFLLVGIPLLIALGIVGIIFPIIGAVKATNGEAWKYPLSIPFLK